jgi:flavodoxin
MVNEKIYRDFSTVNEFGEEVFLRVGPTWGDVQIKHTDHGDHWEDVEQTVNGLSVSFAVSLDELAWVAGCIDKARRLNVGNRFLGAHEREDAFLPRRRSD